ncbi:hypothetical protein AR276_10065 [Stenotrophomonas maltophilia]|nr:hypothetical protein AR276_10065 [Stenotrophomonas maltophilia]
MLCSRAMSVFGSSAGLLAGASWIGCGAGEWGWVMAGLLACMQKPPPIKVAGGARFETRSTLNRQAQGLHAPPAIVGRRIASRHHLRGDAGWQAFTSA